MTFEPAPIPTTARAAAIGPIAPIDWLPEPQAPQLDPAAILLTCANCGAAMDERKCKLICRCGYFLSCSDYY